MNIKTRPQWLRALRDLDPQLGMNADDPDTWRSALVRVWTLVASAPADAQAVYGALAERDLLTAASEAFDRGQDMPASLDVAGWREDRDRMLGLGGWLRAAERWIDEGDQIPLPGEPGVDWRFEVDGEDFFLVPMRRSRWRPDRGPDAPPRPLTKRALLRCRVLPASIRGLPVELEAFQAGVSETRALSFGASLFADFDIEADDEADAEHFLAKAAQGPTRERVVADLVEGATAGCAVHVFPELTLTSDVRAVIPLTLSQAPWAKAGDLLAGPDFVVAGSWHARDDAGVHNEATIYDRKGEELLRFRKVFPYRDASGRPEKIIPGDRLKVLVTSHGLFGFCICLDFCQRYMDLLTSLDVDWMIVPSCGEWRTMSEHLSAARDLQVRFDTRSFVVQQVHPKRQDGALGYVLPAPPAVGALSETDLIISQPFTLHMTSVPTER